MRVSGRRRAGDIRRRDYDRILRETPGAVRVEPVQRLAEAPSDPYDDLTAGDKALVALYRTATPIQLLCGVIYVPMRDGEMRARAQRELLATGVIRQSEIERANRRQEEWFTMRRDSGNRLRALAS